MTGALEPRHDATPHDATPHDGELGAHLEAPLDPATVQRIIRRAVEIAGPEQLGDPAASTGTSRAALVEAAAEVGLPVEAVLRSLAIEQLGPLPPLRATDRLVGPALLTVDGELPLEADEVLARIDHWLVEGHHLRRERLRRDRGEWSKRGGMVGVTVRKVRKATGEGRLGDAARIAVVAEDAGFGTSAVRVVVDRQSERNVAAAAGGSVAALGGVGSVALAASAGPLALVAAPFVVAGGLAVALSGRRRAQRTANEVERLLDAVADGQPPTRLRHEVAQRVIGRPPRSNGRRR